MFSNFFVQVFKFSYVNPIHCRDSLTSSIYKFSLSVCLSDCLFVSNKRQNSWTDRAQIFCGILVCWPLGRFMNFLKFVFESFCFCKILKICKFFMKSANKIWFPINFQKPRNFFRKWANFFLFFFLNVHKENMFTI